MYTGLYIRRSLHRLGLNLHCRHAGLARSLNSQNDRPINRRPCDAFRQAVYRR